MRVVQRRSTLGSRKFISIPRSHPRSFDANERSHFHRLRSSIFSAAATGDPISLSLRDEGKSRQVSEGEGGRIGKGKRGAKKKREKKADVKTLERLPGYARKTGVVNGDVRQRRVQKKGKQRKVLCQLLPVETRATFIGKEDGVGRLNGRRFARMATAERALVVALSRSPVCTRLRRNVAYLR